MTRLFAGMRTQQDCLRTFGNPVPVQRSQAHEEEGNWIQRKLELETACKEPFLLFTCFVESRSCGIGCGKDLEIFNVLGNGSLKDMEKVIRRQKEPAAVKFDSPFFCAPCSQNWFQGKPTGNSYFCGWNLNPTKNWHQVIWRFLEMGVPLNHPFYEDFPWETNLLGDPPFMDPPYDSTYRRPSAQDEFMRLKQEQQKQLQQDHLPPVFFFTWYPLSISQPAKTP